MDCQAGHWDAVHYQRILAPLDGSQRAESVLPIAAAVAQAHHAELILAHVVTRPEMVQRMPLTAEDLALADQLVERNQTQVMRYFEQLENRLEPKPQTYLLVNAHVTATLYKLVEQQQVDLVLLSAHGTSGQNQWPYGSIVTSFIMYGATPLLVVQDLSLQEIAPTQAERATEQTQSGWLKNNGGDEKPGVLEYMLANGNNGHQQDVQAAKGLTALMRNNSNHKTERVGNYAYTALL
jgi:nucleotide-binding universal stress UspA family protein